MKNDNKNSPQNQGVNDLSTQKVIDTPHPMSTPVNGGKYYPHPPVKGCQCDSNADNIVLPTFELPPYTKKKPNPLR